MKKIKGIMKGILKGIVFLILVFVVCEVLCKINPALTPDRTISKLLFLMFGSNILYDGIKKLRKYQQYEKREYRTVLGTLSFVDTEVKREVGKGVVYKIYTCFLVYDFYDNGKVYHATRTEKHKIEENILDLTDGPSVELDQQAYIRVYLDESQECILEKEVDEWEHDGTTLSVMGGILSGIAVISLLYLFLHI